MVKDVQYISIKEVISRLLRHPLLQELNLEAATQYTVDFLHIMGMDDMYEDKEVQVEIENYRGKLPCDLLQVVQVRNEQTGMAMRSTTDSFKPQPKFERRHAKGYYSLAEESTFKVQNQVIFTSFKEGWVTVAYKAIYVDDEGYPMVIDNSNFLKALELYIKQEMFTILFDQNKITSQVLSNTKQEYAWAVGRCESEFSIPSINEMESIKNDWNAMIPRMTEFDTGFRNLGNREYLRRH